MTGVPFEEEMIAAVDRIRPAVVQVRRPIDPKGRRRGSAPLEGAGPAWPSPRRASSSRTVMSCGTGGT